MARVDGDKGQDGKDTANDSIDLHAQHTVYYSIIFS